MRRTLALLLLALSSCARARSPGDLAVSSAEDVATVRIEDGRAHGPNIEVKRFDDELRGTWRGARVNARLSPTRVTGVIDSRPLDFHVEERDGALAARGLVAETREEIELTDARLHVRVGSCGYDLKRAEDATYRGYRCGGVPAAIRLPEKWNELSAPERATYVALMLGL
jgi:hypothetical protein